MPMPPEEKGQCGGGNKEGRGWGSFWQAEELEMQELSKARLTLNLNGSSCVFSSSLCSRCVRIAALICPVSLG